MRLLLAYERSFNYSLGKFHKRHLIKNQKTPKFHPHGVSSCYLSNIIQTAMSLPKWSFNQFVFRHFSTSFMDVISPTRFVNHPSFMDYGNYLNNPFVLIIPDKTNLEGKLWCLTSNTITLCLFSMNIITYSLASYLGHCSSWIVLSCTTLHTIQFGIQYRRTTLFNNKGIQP